MVMQPGQIFVVRVIYVDPCASIHGLVTLGNGKEASLNGVVQAFGDGFGWFRFLGEGGEICLDSA